MFKRSLFVFTLAALLASPALGAEPSGDGAGHDGALAMADLRPYAAIPAGPILAGVNGATDSGTSNIFLTALWGGLAGAAVGGAVGLIEGGNYGRDIAIGAGVGILVGAVLGATNVFGDTRDPTRDGLGSNDRDPVIQGMHLGLLAGRF